MPIEPAVGLADEYLRAAWNGTPKPAICRSDQARVNAPVPVFTPAPRIACPIELGDSALPHPQPAACAAGTAGGVAVVRALALPDGADPAGAPLASVPVTETAFGWSLAYPQPSGAPKLRQF